MVGSLIKRARREALAKAITEGGEVPELRAARDALGIALYVADMSVRVSAFGPGPLYEQRFCQTVIDDAALGHTLTATAALLGVAPQTLSDWQARYREFAAAAARARSIRQRFFEGQWVDAARCGGPRPAVAGKLALANGGDDCCDRGNCGGVKMHFASLAMDSQTLSSLMPATMIEGEVGRVSELGWLAADPAPFRV